MTFLADRGEYSEAVFFHQEEGRFLDRVRRDRRLGLWAARRMGLDRGEAATYAAFLVNLDLISPCDRSLVDRVRKDLEAAHVSIDRHEIDRVLRILSRPHLPSDFSYASELGATNMPHD